MQVGREFSTVITVWRKAMTASLIAPAISKDSLCTMGQQASVVTNLGARAIPWPIETQILLSFPGHAACCVAGHFSASREPPCPKVHTRRAIAGKATGETGADYQRRMTQFTTTSQVQVCKDGHCRNPPGRRAAPCGCGRYCGKIRTPTSFNELDESPGADHTV